MKYFSGRFHSNHSNLKNKKETQAKKRWNYEELFILNEGNESNSMKGE